MVDEVFVQATKQTRVSGGAYTLPEMISGGTLAEAYAHQHALIDALRMEDSVGPVAGFKLAVNGAPQMAHFGVTEPISGALFAREIALTPDSRPARDFTTLCVEPEIAAILGPGIATLGDTPGENDVLACIASFAPAIEIIDMRGSKVTDMSLSSAVALNVFNHGCVLGAERIAPQDLRIEEITARLSIDGVVVETATNNAPQSPVAAVTWLVHHLTQRNIALREGMIVLCGTHIPIHAVPQGSRHVGIDMSGLGSAALSLN